MQDQEIIIGNWNPFDFLISGTSPIIIILIVIFFILLLLSIFTNKSMASRMKRGRMFIFILILSFFFVPVNLSYANNDESCRSGVYCAVVFEKIDLKVDGSGNGGANVSLTNTFGVISRIVTRLLFSTNTFNINEFGSDPALINGTKLFVTFRGSTVDILGNNSIKKNSDFGQFGFDVDLIVDERSPKDYMLMSRLSFNKFVPSGLDNRSGDINNLFFQVNDDLTNGSSTEYSVVFEGYREIVDTYFSTGELYYPNTYNSFNLRFLKRTLNYNLKINSSSHESLDWVNTTAKTETIKITFYVQAQDDNVISLWLYQGDTFLERHDLVVIPIQTGIIEVFLSFLPFLIASFIAISLFFALVIPDSFKGRRK